MENNYVTNRIMWHSKFSNNYISPSEGVLEFTFNLSLYIGFSQVDDSNLLRVLTTEGNQSTAVVSDLLPNTQYVFRYEIALLENVLRFCV